MSLFKDIIAWQKTQIAMAKREKRIKIAEQEYFRNLDKNGYKRKFVPSFR